jgi:hypothetical protein
MSSDFIKTFVEDHAQIRQLAPMIGRSYGIELGRVTDRNDPDGLGRVKATTAAKGGATNTDWLYRLTLPGLSFPSPAIGQTVAIAYENGDPHKGYYWTMQNLPNPAYTPDALRFRLGSTEVLIEQDGAVSITGFNALTINGANVTIDAGAIALNGPTTISGKAAIVVGSKDTGGDTNNDSGQ